MTDPRHQALAVLHHPAHRTELRGALVIATSAIVSLTVVGCGNDGPLDPRPGTGRVTVTGAVNVSGTGTATFFFAGDRTTVLDIIIEHPNAWQLQLDQNSVPLTVGTYDLVPQLANPTKPTALFAYYIGDTANPPWRGFTSTSGQLVIISSSPSEIRGTFSFTGTEYGGTGSVSVNGSFDACGSPPVCE